MISLKKLVIAVATVSITPFQVAAQTYLEIVLDVCAHDARTVQSAVASFELRSWRPPKTNEIEKASAILTAGTLITEFSAGRGLNSPRQAALDMQQRAKRVFSGQFPDGVHALLDPAHEALVMVWPQPEGQKLSCALYGIASEDVYELIDDLSGVGGQDDGKFIRSAWKMFREPDLGFADVQIHAATLKEHIGIEELGVAPAVNMTVSIYRLEN